jgi:hypothetical protein
VVPDQNIEVLIYDHCPGAHARKDRLQKSVCFVEFIGPLAQLLVNCVQLLVRGLQFFVHGLQLLVARLEFFTGGVLISLITSGRRNPGQLMLTIRPQWLAFPLIAVALIGPISGFSAAEPKCVPTRPDSQGPFYRPNAPERARTGRGLHIAGIVRSASGCGSLAGANIEWWSANPDGQYDDQHRATEKVDGEGRYRYETDFPGHYPGRPPHLHVRVTAPGHRPLITQLYPKPGQTSLQFDFVLMRE